MIELTCLSQLKVGTKLKIIGKNDGDSYGSVSVKAILHCTALNGDRDNWTEILINRKKNYYFHLENYLAGKSHWVNKVYILPGIDKRLKR
jgi:hypothetical protein